MTDSEFKEFCKSVGRFWGEKTPILVAEECAELIQAVSKYERKPCKETAKNVITEIDDVFVIVGAYMYLHDISWEQIKEACVEKEKRKYISGGDYEYTE